MIGRESVDGCFWHGFVALEAAGGFGLPQSVDGTFTRLVGSLHIAWSAWSTETGRG